MSVALLQARPKKRTDLSCERTAVFDWRDLALCLFAAACAALALRSLVLLAVRKIDRAGMIATVEISRSALEMLVKGLK